MWRKEETMGFQIEHVQGRMRGWALHANEINQIEARRVFLRVQLRKCIITFQIDKLQIIRYDSYEFVCINV
jgi:hypothetical protein